MHCVDGQEGSFPIAVDHSCEATISQGKVLTGSDVEQVYVAHFFHDYQNRMDWRKRNMFYLVLQHQHTLQTQLA